MISTEEILRKTAELQALLPPPETLLQNKNNAIILISAMFVKSCHRM